MRLTGFRVWRSHWSSRPPVYLALLKITSYTVNCTPSYSKPVFNPSSTSAGLHLSTHPPRNFAPQPASFLTPSVAVAMGARDRGAPLSTTTHGRSLLPPSPAYTAATPWRSHCRWWVQELTGAGASSHGANRNCSTHDTPPTVVASPPHSCTACWYAVQ